MPGNRSRGRSRRIPIRMRNAAKREHQLDFRGLTPHGRSDPPRALLNPWNQITLVSLVIGGSDLTNKCITIADCDQFLRNQIGATTQFSRAFRIVEAQAWHIIPNGELNNVVRVRFYSLINETTSCDTIKVLSQVEDYGTPARNATAKFIWPRTHSSNVFGGTSTEVVLRLTLEPSQQVLLHIRAMWRGAGGSISKVTTVDGKTVIAADDASVLFNTPLSRDILDDVISLGDLTINDSL